MKLPQVSVIVPAFNAEATIVEAVQSVRRQTFVDWELIVVDDGSTDDTEKRLASIDERRVRIVAGPRHGVARARNLGIEHARGELITFLDADNLWTADKLARQVAALHASPAAGAAYSWTAFIDHTGRFLFTKEACHFEGRVYADLLVTFFLASGSNVMARKRCLTSVEGFDEAMEPVEDWELWLRVSDRWPFALVLAVSGPVPVRRGVSFCRLRSVRGGGHANRGPRVRRSTGHPPKTARRMPRQRQAARVHLLSGP